MKLGTLFKYLKKIHVSPDIYRLFLSNAACSEESESVLRIPYGVVQLEKKTAEEFWGSWVDPIGRACNSIGNHVVATMNSLTPEIECLSQVTKRTSTC